MKHISTIQKVKILSLFSLIGVIIFYFLLHPLNMTVYASKNQNYSSIEMENKIVELIKSAFTFEMLPMAYSFIFSGGLIGLLFGFFWLNILKQKRKINVLDNLLVKDIKGLINEGENHFVEFKSSIRYDFQNKTTNRKLESVIIKTIVGFLNSNDGGKLIIGVDDKGGILGLDKDFHTLKHKNEDGFERLVFDLITNKIGSEFCQFCTLKFNFIEQKIICIVYINPSSKPAYLNDVDKTIFYLRMGNSTRELSVKETVDYLEIRKKN
tara:strand:+ start:120 stop:920 length:801 start_codon:yes stop_codon:yes gene_type:complete